MCIRDRTLGKFGAGLVVGLLLGLLCVGVSTLLVLLLLSAPVSYTHLRAHETVLDLVCRLLLEKKKTIEP